MAVCHLLALIALFLSDLSVEYFCLLLTLSLLSLLWQLNRCRLSYADAVLAVRWDANRKQMFLFLRDSGWLQVEQIETAVALPWVVVLRLRMKQRYFIQSLVVMRDATDANSFRRLRVLASFGDYLAPPDDSATGSLPGSG